MTSTPNERRQWLSGVAPPATAQTLDDDFWRDASVDDKLTAMLQMIEEASIIAGDGPAPRLQRDLGGLRKARG